MATWLLTTDHHSGWSVPRPLCRLIYRWSLGYWPPITALGDRLPDLSATWSTCHPAGGPRGSLMLTSSTTDDDHLPNNNKEWTIPAVLSNILGALVHAKINRKHGSTGTFFYCTMHVRFWNFLKNSPWDWSCCFLWDLGGGSVTISDLMNTWLFLCDSFVLLSVWYIYTTMWILLSLNNFCYNWFDFRMREGLWVYCNQWMQGLNWWETVIMQGLGQGQYHSTRYSLPLHLLLQILHLI